MYAETDETVELLEAQTRAQLKMLNWVRMIGFMVAVWFFLSIAAATVWVLSSY